MRALARDLPRSTGLTELACTTGTAGTGKSFVIERIHEYVTEVAAQRGWSCPEAAAVVAAYTGVAAFNVKGRTLHSLLGLPTDPKDFTDVKGKALEKLQDRLECTHLLILDERSMIGRRTLSWLSSRAKQAKANDDVSFGGLGVIQLGGGALNSLQLEIFHCTRGT